MKISIDYGYEDKENQINECSLEDAITYCLSIYPRIIVEHWSASWNNAESREWDYEITLYNGYME